MTEFAPDGKDPVNVGELLIKENLVKKTDIKKALLIQEKEKKAASIPLSQIMMDKGFITEKQLDTLIHHHELKTNIGELIVKKGFLSTSKLATCLQRKKTEESLDECLINQGIISADDLSVFIRQHISGKELGELAVKLNMISRKELNETLKIKGTARTLGEILCDSNLISPIELNRVLQKYNKQLKFGEILVKLGILEGDKLTAALREQRHSNEPLGIILLNNKMISVDQLYTALSKQYNIPFRRLSGFAFDPGQKKTLVSIVTPKYAEKNLILPLSLDGNKLTLALSVPENLKVLQELSAVYSRLKMNCILITDGKFHELYEILYNRPLSEVNILREATIKREKADVLDLEMESIEETADTDAPYGILDMEADEIVNFIIKYGIMNNASDIHIEQDRQGASLRYRFDGVLHPLNLKWLDEKLQTMIPAIISRIKVMSNLDIAERRIPQDGVFRINFYDKEKSQRVNLDFRVATCPAIVGENITIRILDPRKAKVSMDTLGHSPHVLDPLKQLLKSSSGIILVSGPTGSGKSSTLYSALQFIYHPGIKIITVEDPIEYSFPGIMQTQIKPKIGLDFPRVLRSFLRLDPDVILVGEIRDEETARIGFDASQTGHLLLSTIHTNDSFSSITRLLDLNIEHNQIASSLMGVLAQRLVRKICPSCRKKYQPTEDEWSLVYPSFPRHLEFFMGEGCNDCDFTGYKGRSLISELMVVNRKISTALNRGLGENEIRQIALNSGTKTMVDDGILKLDQTTLSEIIRVVPYEMLKEFRSRQTSTTSGKSQRDLPSHNWLDDELPDNNHLIVRNPAEESEAIDLFYTRYAKKKRKRGLSVGPSEKSIFREFITGKHSEICNRFNCQSVVFYLDDTGKLINITAAPPISGMVPDISNRISENLSSLSREINELKKTIEKHSGDWYSSFPSKAQPKSPPAIKLDFEDFIAQKQNH